LEFLQRLLASDLSKADLDELYEGIKASELVFDQAQVWTGRLVAELRRRPGVSWRQVEEATGVPKATLDRRAGKAP
jgi:hypothetical protein